MTAPDADYAVKAKLKKEGEVTNTTARLVAALNVAHDGLNGLEQKLSPVLRHDQPTKEDSVPLAGGLTDLSAMLLDALRLAYRLQERIEDIDNRTEV